MSGQPPRPGHELLGPASEGQEYFAAIEAHFGRLRGRPLLLSPRDVGLVRQWHEAGVPLRVALKGLDRFFEREQRRERPRRRAPTLEYCEADVFEMWEEWKSLQLGAPGADPSASLLGPHLAGLPGRLEQAAAAADSAGAVALGRALGRAARRVAELTAGAGDIAVLEPELQREEQKIVRAIRTQLGPGGVAQVQAEIDARLAAHGGGIDGKALEVLGRKALERALLARFAVPRIAVFSF